MLKLENVSVFYGHVNALKGVSLEATEGELIAVIGGNGAGKTTLLKTIAGLLKPGVGRIFFKGREITHQRADQIVKMGLSLCPEERQLFVKMSVRENLEMGAYFRHDDCRADFQKVYELFPRLADRKHQRASSLSGGEQQMLAIGRALMSKPELILFDEPSLGLAPNLRDEVTRTLQILNAGGKTIILVEQHVEQAFKIAQRGYVLENGRIVLSDCIESLTNSAQIKKAYLGG